jgi:AAA domain
MPFDDPACFGLDRIPVRPIHWLWRPYLACGKLAVLDGDPGAGKSLFTVDLAARLTRGGRMPDGSWRRKKANVLFLNAEDALDDTLRPRLDAAGADVNRVFCLGGVQVGIADGAEMSFPGCFDALRRAVVAHQIELIVIDPMMAFFKPAVPTNSDQVMRVALAPLAALAARSGATVLLVRQLSKHAGRKALYRGGGSIGIIGAIRTALFLGRTAEPDRRILAMTKSNIGPTAPALACRLAEEAGRPRLEWLGECDATADDLCRPPAPGAASDRATADEWLLAALASGPQPAKELQEEARAAGYCLRTLERAKRRVGVVARRVRKGGRAFWQWSVASPFAV